MFWGMKCPPSHTKFTKDLKGGNFKYFYKLILLIIVWGTMPLKDERLSGFLGAPICGSVDRVREACEILDRGPPVEGHGETRPWERREGKLARAPVCCVPPQQGKRQGNGPVSKEK